MLPSSKLYLNATLALYNENPLYKAAMQRACALLIVYNNEVLHLKKKAMALCRSYMRGKCY